MSRILIGFLLLALVAGVRGQNATQRELELTYPGVRFFGREGRTEMVYGRGMSYGLTARESADAWLNSYGGVFGAQGLSLHYVWAKSLKGGAMTVFAYSQTRQGFPVYGALVRVLVKNEPVPQVVFASARVGDEPRGGIGEVAVSAQAAAGIAAINGYGLARELPVFVQLVRDIGRQDSWAWKVITYPIHGEVGGYHVFVDAITGHILRTEPLIADADATGTVRAYATPLNWYPDLTTLSANVPVLTYLPAVKVTGPSVSTMTDWTGVYVLSFSGPGTVATGLGPTSASAGTYCWVYDWDGNGTYAGTALSGSGTVTPPAVRNFTLGPGPTIDYGVAQANAVVVLKEIYEFIYSYSSEIGDEPAWMSTPIRINVNYPWVFSGRSFYNSAPSPVIYFGQERILDGDLFVNACYSGVIPHEYGHHIIICIGLANSSGFAEGFGDTFVILMQDHPEVGRGWIYRGMTTEEPLRENPLVANCQYPISELDPCGSDWHAAGELLSGVWWDLRNNLFTTYSGAAGVEVCRSLFANWLFVTEGGEDELNPAYEATLIEVLTVDDNDANLANGTPNGADICAAFASHSISTASCP